MKRETTIVFCVNEVELNADTQSISSAHGECNARAISRWTGTYYGRVWRFLRIIVTIYSYNIQHVHELKSPNFVAPQEFANSVFVIMKNTDDCISNVLWTDEANFSLRGNINQQNCHRWIKEHRHALMAKWICFLHGLKVTVWSSFTFFSLSVSVFY